MRHLADRSSGHSIRVLPRYGLAGRQIRATASRPIAKGTKHPNTPTNHANIAHCRQVIPVHQEGRVGAGLAATADIDRCSTVTGFSCGIADKGVATTGATGETRGASDACAFQFGNACHWGSDIDNAGITRHAQSAPVHTRCRRAAEECRMKSLIVSQASSKRTADLAEASTSTVQSVWVHMVYRPSFLAC